MSWKELFASEDVQENQEEPSSKNQNLGLFDIIKDISEKKGLTTKVLKETGSLPKAYNAFMIARAFGNSFDTVLWANEWNTKYQMPDTAQFMLFYGAIKPKKRFEKWYKSIKEEEINHLADLFGYSVKEMKSCMENVPKEIIETLETKLRNAENKKVRK